MDYDIPLPSIEQDDSHTFTFASASSTNTGTKPQESFPQRILETAVGTPLPASSPVKTPRKTFKLQHDDGLPQLARQSPSRQPSASSPLNPDRRSSTPLLHSRRSIQNLQSQRAGTPLRQTPSRHSSYNSSTSESPKAAMQQHLEEKKPPITAASVAKEYFHKEMRLHEESKEPDVETLVLIHDSCYGHRYSRPRSSKSLLSTIVERPERIHASVLGLSAAYVRMGGRYAGGFMPPRPDWTANSSAGIPFTIRKTSRSVSLNSIATTHVHGQKWMEELQIMCDSAEGKLALNGKELARPIGYGKDENGNPLPKLHEGDLYLCSESLNALEGCLGGVCDAVDAVFSSGNVKRAFVCIRPPGHHCSSNYPSGFCWINNVHVGITHAAITHGLTHAAIIDFDLHHGDGSQTIAWEHNRRALNLPKNAASHKKTPIGYFSLHDINSYPCEMGDDEKVHNASLCIENAHGQSIWNVHLESWKSHSDFWRLYESRYIVLLDKARTFLRHHTEKLNNSLTGTKAKAAIFLSAGFDASEWEGEGMQRHKVNVPTDFYARFTADVVKLAEEEGLGVDGRIISVLEGGYSDRALTSGVLSHVCGLAQESSSHNNQDIGTRGGLSVEQKTAYGMLRMDDGGSTRPQNGNKIQFDTEWWNLRHLEALELLVNPPADPLANVKAKDKKSGNYTSPTQASTAKMTEHARVRRSVSGQLERLMLDEPEPIPPAPDVDWATAAHELSRVLIPSDRQTLSCRHDELNAEATRVRRERQSTIGLPTSGEQRMQLRDRKTRALGSDEEAARPISRGGNRRKTIAAVGELPDPNMSQVDDQADGASSAAGRPRRRSSGASSVIAGFKNMQITESADNSMASRSSSVVPENTAKVAKKARIVSAPRLPPAKPRTSPKKAVGTAPPVPRVPSGFRRQPSSSGPMPTEPQSFADVRQSSLEQVGSAGEASAVKDFNDISSGMKKMSVKLKVPSPEEHAAREKKAAEEKLKKPRVGRKPGVPKGPKTTKSTSAKPSVAVVDATLAAPSLMIDEAAELQPGTVKTEQPVMVEQIPVLAQQKEDISNSVTPQLEEQISEVPYELSTTNADVPPAYESIAPQLLVEPRVPDTEEATISHYQPPLVEAVAGNDLEHQAQHSTSDSLTDHTSANTMIQHAPSTQQAALQDPLPRSAPSSEKKTKADLPVFSSRSPIPFAANSKIGISNGDLYNLYGSTNSTTSNQQLQQKQRHPDFTAGMGAADRGTGAVPVKPAGEIVEESQQEENKREISALSAISGAGIGSGASIWDVPETPQR